MNIRIIEPYHFDRRYDLRSLTPSMGPVVIGKLLKRAGHKVEVISEYVSRLDVERLNSADLVGISIATYNAGRGFEIAQHIRKPVVFGGFHASLAPEECLNYGDYVIRGDGHPVVALADSLGKKERDIHQIPNLAYKKDGRSFYNQTETKSINVVPDFSLVKDYYRLNLNRLLRLPLLVYASRGCHCRCAFCSIKEIYDDFKKRDSEIIIEDIKSQIKHQHFLSKFLPKIIWITDDNFFSDRAWAKDVLKELAQLKTGYQFNIQARPDIAYDDELLRLMRKAHFGFVSLGIESLNQESLSNFGKGSTVSDVKYAVKKIKHFGMDVYGLFVFGDDQFVKGDGLRVAEFARRHHLSGVLIQPLTPFPGTKMFRDLKKEGRILHEDWGEYNGKVVFMPKNLTATQLQEEISACYRSVYSPARLLRFLICGKKGFRLTISGIGVMRHLEGLRSRNYLRDRLSD